MNTRSITSWGRTVDAEHELVPVSWRDAPLPRDPAGGTMLPYGLGRSYGDSCLNDGATLLATRGLDRFISFDRESGVLRCEAGVSLDEIVRLVVPQGWFLPVTPGTKFVTVGGAIANDVHGKNHHRVGTFGRFVRRFELLRSDGTRLTCSAVENAEWFRATIGGLGLTGLITWAELSLRPIANALVDNETVRLGSLDEFFPVNEDSEQEFEYTVAWIDCLASGKSLGRGHYMRGNHAPPQPGARAPRPPLPLAVPFDLPSFTIGTWSVAAFNEVYYRRQLGKSRRALVGFDPFFYPLDAVSDWNRAYGKRGFFQYQFVVPLSDSRVTIREILERISRSRQASFLAVLKTFGDAKSPGLLSFPRPGVTLALDLPNRGDSTLALFRELDEVVAQAGGAVYPAKDARMSPENFRRFFPQADALQPFVDPRFSSSFWRRIGGGEARVERALESA